jgi:hypothetical protein
MSNDMNELTQDLAIANVAVLSSRLQVGAATAVSWLTRRSVDLVYVVSAADGLERLTQKASRRGVALPPEAPSLCEALDRLASTEKKAPLENLKALL